MCDVHLVPEVDEIRAATEDLVCFECDQPIPTGAAYRHIEGALDDGSPGRLIYRAHDDCYELTILDYDDNDGCFTYGRVEEVKS